jgi:hypothetical protein
VLIVTAGTGHYEYETTIRYCEKKCEEYGYKLQVYDLGGLGFGTLVEDPRNHSKFRFIKCAIKPELILESMNNTDEELIVWIDGDATLINRIDELVDDDSFDVGVTVRRKVAKKKTAYVNAGVLFFKNNVESKLFLQSWIDAMGPVPSLTTEVKSEVRHYDDQSVLEEKLLLPNISGALWDQQNTVHVVCGARVKIFDCATYNNFWMTPLQVEQRSCILRRIRCIEY